jgi:hypothetical protein
MTAHAIRLDDLAAGMPGITPRIGAVLAEAATVCFEDHGIAAAFKGGTTIYKLA